MKRRSLRKNLNAEGSDRELIKDRDESADPLSQGETKTDFAEFLDSLETISPPVQWYPPNYHSSLMSQPQKRSFPHAFDFERAPPLRPKCCSPHQLSGEHDQLRRPRVPEFSASVDHSWSPSKDSASVSSATTRQVPWDVLFGGHERFPPSAEAKSELMVNFMTPYQQKSKQVFLSDFASAEQKAEEPVRAAGSSQLDEEASERKMISLETKKAPQSPPWSFSLHAGSVPSVKNLGTRHDSQESWSISREPSWTQPTDPSVSGPGFPESSSEETQQHTEGFMNDTQRSYADAKERIRRSSLREHWSGFGLRSLPETPDSWEKNNRSTRVRGVSRSLSMPLRSLAPTGVIYPPINRSSSQISIPSSRCHSILDVDTEEHPEAQNLYEVLEPATRFELFSPPEADSPLQSSTTDSSERKDVSRSSKYPLSPKTSAKSKIGKRAAGLPDMKLKSSFMNMWTQSTDPSVSGPGFPESSSEETQQHAEGFMNDTQRIYVDEIDYCSLSPRHREPFIHRSSLIKNPEPESVLVHPWHPSQDSNVSTLTIAQRGSTSPSPATSDLFESGSFRTNPTVDDDDDVDSEMQCGITSVPWRMDSELCSDESSSSQSSFPLVTDSSCLESVSEEKQEHPEAQSLHEILEPTNMLELFSPPEAGSPLQSSRMEVSCSSSFPSSPKTSAKSKSLQRAASLPDMKMKSSFEEFSPDCTDEVDGEAYRFQCSCPGLYQCRETGLVFDMKEGGQVLYRILTWNRRQLRPHHKKPAGPLFDIKCLKEGSMSQLHLPHCEIRSTGGCGFLSVAHVKDDDIEFIRPEKITETHVIIKVSGFSGFGNVKDEDSPSVPIRALVLLFYRPPLDHKLKYIISVLLLPNNVVLRSVLHFRRNFLQGERYIETPPQCKLCPNQPYSLTTSPGGDSVRVQPSNAEFYEDHNENYLPTFQVIYETMMNDIELFLKDSSSTSVWESLVCLPPSRPTRPDLSSNQLRDICSGFIQRVSGPVLQSLLDKLLEKKVINDPERESAEEIRNRGDRARFVLDTVRRKGEAASSEMIEILRELDPFFCEDLGLI